jgi:hypothetical protein
MKPLTRPGAKFVAKLPRGEKCVGMIVFQGKVFVATDRRVMKLVGNKLRTVLFEC